MRFLISLLIVLGLPAIFGLSKTNKKATAQDQAKVAPAAISTYCNSRFGFCIKYSPELLTAQQVAENGDGVILQTATATGKVKVNGSYNVFNWTPADLYAFNLEETLPGEPEKVVVVSKIIGDDFYECLLLSEGKSIFQRGFVLGEAYVQLIIEAPASRPELMEELRASVKVNFQGPGI